MTQGLKGHNITCDNFFTSYNLGQELLKRKLTMVGTVRKNKPELPRELLAMQNRASLTSMFAFTDTTTIVSSYSPKKHKNVVLMSTMHKDAAVSTREDKKPAMILDYNATKGGVDNLDKVTGTYSCKKKMALWPLVVFYNIIDVSAYNTFVLWTEMDPGWHSGNLCWRRLFFEQLGKALVNPHILRRKFPPRAPAAAAIVERVQAEGSGPPVLEVPAGSRKRGRCHICPWKKDTKTATQCCKCKKLICRSHTHTYCPSCSM